MEHNIHTPEETMAIERLKDLRNWYKSLKHCNPTFAKTFIMQKLIPNEAMDDDGRARLFAMLKLEAA